MAEPDDVLRLLTSIDDRLAELVTMQRAALHRPMTSNERSQKWRREHATKNVASGTKPVASEHKNGTKNVASGTKPVASRARERDIDLSSPRRDLDLSSPGNGVSTGSTGSTGSPSLREGGLGETNATLAVAFEEAWAAYGRKGAKQVAFAEYRKHVRPAERELFLSAVRNYVGSTPDRRYLRDMERFIKPGVGSSVPYWVDADWANRSDKAIGVAVQQLDEPRIVY